MALAKEVGMPPARDWATYNASQVSEWPLFCQLLCMLVSNVQQPPQVRGRPRLPMSDLLFVAGHRIYANTSGRRFQSQIDQLFDMGYISCRPHYNSAFNFLGNPDVHPLLKALITRTALPLKALETNFAVDSSGFGTTRKYNHYSAKWGVEMPRRQFVHLHIMVGCQTHIITAAHATVGRSGDAPTMPRLIEETVRHFNVAQVAADGAYCSRQNVELLDAHGIDTFIPFAKNAIPDGINADSEAWMRLYHFFSLHRATFLRSYHSQNNIESTFSSMKRKIGDQLRSKTDVALINEALLKCVVYNLLCLCREMHESRSTAIGQSLVEMVSDYAGRPSQATPSVRIGEVA